MSKELKYNGGRHPGLYCEECGWLACYHPEVLYEGAECVQCNHKLGTSGAAYDYTTGVWDEDELFKIYGGSDDS